jgi:hypothetical protein
MQILMRVQAPEAHVQVCLLRACLPHLPPPSWLLPPDDSPPLSTNTIEEGIWPARSSRNSVKVGVLIGAYQFGGSRVAWRRPNRGRGEEGLAAWELHIDTLLLPSPAICCNMEAAKTKEAVVGSEAQGVLISILPPKLSR